MIKYCDGLWNGTEIDKTRNVSMRERKNGKKLNRMRCTTEKNYTRNCDSTTLQMDLKRSREPCRREKNWRNGFWEYSFFYSPFSIFKWISHDTRNMSTRITIAVAIARWEKKSCTKKEKASLYLCWIFSFFFNSIACFLPLNFQEMPPYLCIHPDLQLYWDLFERADLALFSGSYTGSNLWH